MATATAEEIDYFDITAVAARSSKVSPATLIRFEKVRLQLAALGIRRDDERIPLWMAPILCTTPDARRAFLDSMPITRPVAKDVPTEDRRDIHDKQSSTRGRQGQKPSPWKRPGTYMLLVLLLVSAIALAWLLWPTPPMDTASTPVNVNSVPPEPIPAPPPPPPEQPEQNSVALILMTSAPLLAALVYIAWLRRRRRIIRRDHAPAPDRSIKLAFATGVDQMFSDRTLRKALGNLRRHRAVASTKLNVHAAIKATIRAGGLPQVRYGFRPRSPDYLLFNERESPADHLGLVGRLFAKRMAEENVAHSRYEYFGDPRRLQLIERDAPAGVFPLASVLARHDGARVMMLQESHDCFGEEKSPEWLSRIVETERPVLLNPRARNSWGLSEARLTALGMGIVAPSSGGIVDYGDYLNTVGNVRRRLAQGRSSQFDLPESLAPDRDLLLGNEPPPDDVIAELISDLDIWLGPSSAYWLRGLALFPSIDPGFTVFLGKALSDDEGRELMDEARFIDLARLPWLRAGRMPKWLRGALVRGLTSGQLEAATAAIQAFLFPADQPADATSIDFSRGESRKLRRNFLDWLRMHPENLLSDQLLIEALNGRPPDELGVEAPKGMLRDSQTLWASNEARAIMLGFAATIGIVVWQWERIFPPPPEAQVADSTNVPPPAPVLEDVPPAVDITPPDGEPSNVAEPVTNVAEGGTDGANALPTPEDVDSSVANDTTQAASDPVADDSKNDVPPRSEPNTKIDSPEQSRPAPPEEQKGPIIESVWSYVAVNFDWDSTRLTSEAVNRLDGICSIYMRRTANLPPEQRGSIRVRVVGHTDSSSSPDYAVGLSGRMAQSVATYLIDKGIPASAISTEAMGSARPIVKSRTKDGREPQNRRVEVTVYGPESAPTAS